MEDYIIGLLSALVGAVAFMVGRVFQPKQQALRQTAQRRKEEVDSLRAEVKRYRAKASYYQKGAVPSELGNLSEPDKLVEGIIENLPANYRMMLGPMKGEIVKLAKENPE